jgi:hypothetical protein
VLRRHWRQKAVQVFKVHLQLNFVQTGVLVTSVVAEAGAAGALVDVVLVTRASRVKGSIGDAFRRGVADTAAPMK